MLDELRAELEAPAEEAAAEAREEAAERREGAAAPARLVESEGRSAPVSLVRVHRSSPWRARDAWNAPLEARAVEAAASARERGGRRRTGD